MSTESYTAAGGTWRPSLVRRSVDLVAASLRKYATSASSVWSCLANALPFITYPLAARLRVWCTMAFEDVHIDNTAPVSFSRTRNRPEKRAQRILGQYI